MISFLLVILKKIKPVFLLLNMVFPKELRKHFGNIFKSFIEKLHKKKSKTEIPNKNLPEVMYPGVPLAGAGSDAPAPKSELKKDEEVPAKNALPKPQFTAEEKNAYGNAGVFSLVLLVICFFFSNNFIEKIFFLHKEEYNYTPKMAMKFFGIVPPPILLVYCIFAVALPVFIALFARFVCAKKPINHLCWVWGLYLMYYVAIVISAIRISSGFLFVLCLVFFVLCFFILLHNKENRPKTLKEFMKYTSEIVGEILNDM